MTDRTTVIDEPTDAAIRDYLAAHLEMVEPGLTLVDVDSSFAQSNGFDGFLDICARDPEGVVVIIQIKRTAAASQEALQELSRYVAQLSTNGLARSGKHRITLLSVASKGPLDTHLELNPDAPFAITAGRIELDAQGMPFQVVRLH